jgi:hypothetical protein
VTASGTEASLPVSLADRASDSEAQADSETARQWARVPDSESEKTDSEPASDRSAGAAGPGFRRTPAEPPAPGGLTGRRRLPRAAAAAAAGGGGQCL